MGKPKILNNFDISDITEPKKEEMKLKQFMVDSEHGAIYFKNLKSQYIIVNNKTLETFGLSYEQVIGKNDYEIILNKKEAIKNIENDQFVFNTGKPREITEHITSGHGKGRWIHTIKLPQFDDKGNIIGLVGIVRDITERKKAEERHAKMAESEKKKAEELEMAYEELHTSKDDLVRSEKLAYTGRIAASIAHEIRNPLTNVIMSIQQLKKAINPGNPKVKHIDIIERNTERINYLITELLNCARPPKLNIQPHDIHGILENILESIKVRIRSQKIKIVKNFTIKSSTIEIDREQIERALLNIVINAVDAMPKGGKLTIITELNESLFMVKIQDIGKGIPEKDIIRIFDPFFSSKPGGVGLGLTLCYGIIASHGGTIEVESKLRKGTIFLVTLSVGRRERVFDAATMRKQEDSSWLK